MESLREKEKLHPGRGLEIEDDSSEDNDFGPEV